MPNCDVTLRALTLGAQDSVTGWYAKQFAESTIKMMIASRGATLVNSPMGLYARYNKTGFTADVVAEGDKITDSSGNHSEVATVLTHYWLDSFYCRECELSESTLDADRPATSGTWHLGSSGFETDVRYRQKELLDPSLGGYLVGNDITKDDGLTPATFIICFSNPDYPLTRIFTDKGVDLVFSIETGESEALVGQDKSAYAYHESVPIELFAINKAGITATNLIEKGYQELRRVMETYPTGSVRKLGRTTETSQRLGSPILFSQKCMVEYTRAKA